MTDRPGFKYGMLIAPEADHRPLESLRQLAPDLHWRIGSFEKLVEAREVKSWKEAFGRFQWDEITRENLLVYCVRPSRRANVSDAEHDAIGARLARVLTALQLVDFGVPLRGNATVFTGEARSTTPFDIATVAGFATHLATLSPYYANVQGFWELESDLAKPVGEWVEQWAANIELLDRLDGSIPAPLNVGMLALLEGLHVSYIEFRIPHFVRAAEAVIALSKKDKRDVFVQRAAKLVPDLEKDPFLGPGLEDRLLRMYVLRNECVHGMIPFANMQLQGPAQDLEARRIEYLAERLARRAILHGLRRAHEPCFADRSTLEAAWHSGAMP